MWHKIKTEKEHEANETVIKNGEELENNDAINKESINSYKKPKQHRINPICQWDTVKVILTNEKNKQKKKGSKVDPCL